MIDDAIAELERLVGERAFTKGAAAYRERKQRHAPAVYGVYCGWWVRGYDNAALSDAANDLRAN